MVVLMHYAAIAVLEAHGPREVREAIARGEHLSSLAFSEAGSRSHFWAPMSTATADGDGVRLDARKSWVTSAGEADSYVWSSRPLAADGPMTLWLVPSDAAGPAGRRAVRRPRPARQRVEPVTAEGVVVPRAGDARRRRRRPGHRARRGAAGVPDLATPRSRVGLTDALLDEAGDAPDRRRGWSTSTRRLAQQPVDPGRVRAAAHPRRRGPRLPRRHPRRAGQPAAPTRRCGCCRSRRSRRRPPPRSPTG